MSEMILTKRCGRIDPGSIDEYMGAGGYTALVKALKMKREDIIGEVKVSGLKGRGGAGFPAGIKMEAVLKAQGRPKYVVCNADEGEPGNFKDRYLMEKDPHQLIEGMIISAFAVGASIGCIYVRGEYDTPIAILRKAITDAGAKGFLGKNIQGSGFDFDITVQSGAGAYICGEEFALIESIEGKPGRPRFKPPFPTTEGLFGKPTQLNNVETFSNIPYIVLEGGSKFASIGTPGSTGTRLVSLSGNVNRPGVYEVPFGVTLKQIVYELGKGVPGGRKIKMVQLGGASGSIIPEAMLDTRLDYAEMASKGLSAGSAAIIVIDDRFGIFDILELLAGFFRHESCGKCTPCREGNAHLIRIIRKFRKGEAAPKDIAVLESLIDTMGTASLCGLGQAAPTAFATTLKYFRDEYKSRLGRIAENG